MAKLVRTDGSMVVVYPKGRSFTLPELYSLIGGACDMIQVIDLPVEMRPYRQMWLDEEGKLRTPRPPLNEIASTYLAMSGGMSGDVVLGNVLLTKRGEVK